MKFGFLFIVLVLSIVTSHGATYADPASSETYRQNDETASQIDFLKRTGKIAKYGKTYDDDSQHTQEGLLRDAVKNTIIRDTGRDIAQGVGRLMGQSLKEITRFTRNGRRGIYNGKGVGS